MAGLSDILETTQLEKVAGGFVFTEGPLWHPDGFFYFVDIRQNLLYRMVLGQKAEVVRKTIGGNGTTFDLQGRLVQCEGDGRMVTRLEANGAVTTLADRFEGKKLNRPNDVICHSNGSLYFTDPAYRVPMAERELDAAVYRLAPEGAVSLAVPVEYPNGLALSPDERTLYIANTRWCQVHPCGGAGCGGQHGAAAGVRRHVGGWHERRARRHEGRRGRAGVLHWHRGVWVFAPDGSKIGIIEMPEVCANCAFGGPDLRTLFLTASTSVYTLRVKTPGMAHPWYKTRGDR